MSRGRSILQAASFTPRALPVVARARIWTQLGGLLGPRLMSAKASMLDRHLRRVQPEATDGDLRWQRQQGFGSYARYWAESFSLPRLSDKDLDRGFSFIDYGVLQDVRSQGYGPILVLPHLGGWEWAAAWLGRIEKTPVTAVVEALEPEDVHQWFVELRESYGVNVIPVGPKAAKGVLSAIQDRDIVCLLSDRNVGGASRTVSFFGEQTELPAGPAVLARRSGAPLVAAAVFFRGRQRVCLVGQPIWPNMAEPLRTEVQRLTEIYVAALEELISQAPEQWHLLEPNWPSDLDSPDA